MTRTARLVSVLLALILALGLFVAAPQKAHAATRDVANATELLIMIKHAANNDVIRLTANITCNSVIKIADKTITFDLNGKTLTAAASVYVDKGKLLLKDPNNGKFNVSCQTGDGFSLCAEGISKVEVTNVSNSFNGYEAVRAVSSEVIVYGNVTHTGAGGIGVNCYYGSRVTVHGTITVSSSVDYVKVGFTVKTQSDREATSSKTGYYEYKDFTNGYTSIVWVKIPLISFPLLPVYPITINSGSGNEAGVAGATITITANAAPAGRVFDKWTTASADVAFANAASATTTFVMPAHAVTVTATYKAIEISIVTPPGLTLVSNTATVVSGTGGGAYIVGSTVSIAANAAPSGQTFDKWVTASADVAFSNAFSANTTFTMPASAVTVTATYKTAAAPPAPPSPSTYAISVTSGGNGIITSSHLAAAPGTVITLTATPAAGYALNNWEVLSGGVSISNGSTTFTFTMPAAAVSIKGNFQALPPSAITPDPGSSTPGPGTSTPDPGTTTPDPGTTDPGSTDPNDPNDPNAPFVPYDDPSLLTPGGFNWLWLVLIVLVLMVAGIGVAIVLVLKKKKPAPSVAAPAAPAPVVVAPTAPAPVVAAPTGQPLAAAPVDMPEPPVASA